MALLNFVVYVAACVCVSLLKKRASLALASGGAAGRRAANKLTNHHHHHHKRRRIFGSGSAQPLQPLSRGDSPYSALFCNNVHKYTHTHTRERVISIRRLIT